MSGQELVKKSKSHEYLKIKEAVLVVVNVLDGSYG
jgi:hypothetical protein